MLPPNHPSGVLAQLRPVAEEFLQGDLDNFNLTPEDISLIGSYIRIFTFIELNLHRAVRMFRERGSLSEKRARNLVASKLTTLVREGKVCVPMDGTRERELQGHLSEIEIGQPFRNLLAHWACGRLPGTDAFLFITMEERNASVVGDQSIAFNGMYWAAVRRSDLQQLRTRMETSGHWLALQVASWHSVLFER